MTALSSRHFRLVWAGQVVSVIGDGMRTIALLWLARTRFGADALVAVAVASTVPVVLGSPLGGWLADRRDRRRLMVLADVHRGLVSGALALLLLTDHLTAASLVALVAIAACGTAVFDPCFAAAVPSLVRDEERASANSLVMAASSAGALVGPLVGGALVALLGAAWVMALDAISFGIAAVCVAVAAIPRTGGVAGAPVPTSSAADDPGPTLRATFTSPAVRRLSGLACVLNFVVAPLSVMLVSLAVDRHGVGPGLFGLMSVMVPLGLLAGSLFAPRVAGHPLALVTSLLGVGGALALVGLVPLPAALVLLAVGGVAVAVANTVLITSLQAAVSAEVHGRAFGVLTSATQALRPAGLVVAAPLLATAGVAGAYAVVGGAVVAATVAWARPGTQTRWAPGLQPLP